MGGPLSGVKLLFSFPLALLHRGFVLKISQKISLRD